MDNKVKMALRVEKPVFDKLAELCGENGPAINRGPFIPVTKTSVSPYDGFWNVGYVVPDAATQGSLEHEGQR